MKTYCGYKNIQTYINVSGRVWSMSWAWHVNIFRTLNERCGSEVGPDMRGHPLLWVESNGLCGGTAANTVAGGCTEFGVPEQCM